MNKIALYKAIVNHLWDIRITNIIIKGNRKVYTIADNYRIYKYKISYYYAQTKYKKDTIISIQIENDSKQLVDYKISFEDKRLNKNNFKRAMKHSLLIMIGKESM